ncbi:hypothetical protein [Streptomyces sp. MAR4 CNX-425]|uniref:hypothetical protein n=1 Tax=Streptomyces sp. MAR4 CNX-425 TaxID=3406343 RepID=UPI003B5041E7
MVIMNIRALDTTGNRAAPDGFRSMVRRFAGIAADEAMFGRVPNAGAAAQALRGAALVMLRELNNAGGDVDDIRGSAQSAAAVGRGSDDAARRALVRARADALDRFHGWTAPPSAKLPDPAGPGR